MEQHSRRRWWVSDVFGFVGNAGADRDRVSSSRTDIIK